MTYCIYFLIQSFGETKKMFLVDLPDEDNWLSGIGFQSDKRAAGTCPTIEDAEKVIAWLKDDPNDKREYFVEVE